MSTDIIYVYGLIDPITQELRYIGITVNPAVRYYDHIRKARLRLEKTYKSNWVAGLLEKGLVPEMYIIDIQPKATLEFWEQHYISYYRAIGCRLTNMALGGFHNSITDETKKKISNTLTGRKLSNEHVMKLKNRKVTDETKGKISKANKGKVTSSETKAKMSLASIGVKKSAEHRLAIIKANTGRIMSDEVKQMMSDARKGEKNYNYGGSLSEETKKKISESRAGKYTGADNPFFGKKHDEDTRKRISEAITGRKLSEEHKEKLKGKPMSDEHREVLSKPIDEYDGDGHIVRYFVSIQAAAAYHNVTHNSICKNCINNLNRKSVMRKTGTSFKYKNI